MASLPNSMGNLSSLWILCVTRLWVVHLVCCMVVASPCAHTHTSRGLRASPLRPACGALADIASDSLHLPVPLLTAWRSQARASQARLCMRRWLSGSAVRHLPQSIGNLSSLDTLCARHWHLCSGVSSAQAGGTSYRSYACVYRACTRVHCGILECARALLTWVALCRYLEKCKLESLPDSFGALGSLTMLCVPSLACAHRFGRFPVAQSHSRLALRGRAAMFAHLDGARLTVRSCLSFSAVKRLPDSMGNLTSLKEL